MRRELKEILEELKECGDLIDDNQYNDEQRKLLQELQDMKLVVLSWRITNQGVNSLTRRSEDV